MRILAYGECRYGSGPTALFSAFREQECIVDQLDPQWFIPTGSTIPHRILLRALQPTSCQALNSEVLRRARVFKPHVFLAYKGNYLRSGTLKGLREMGIRCINYYPDVSFEAQQAISVDSLRYYDAILTTKPYHLPHLRSTYPQVHSLMVPHGYDPATHRMLTVNGAPIPKEYDVTFVGNGSEYKANFLKDFGSRLRHCRLVVAGNRWEGLQRMVPNAIVFEYGMQGDEYALILNKSRVCLSITHGPHGPEGWSDSITTRTFEIPACGTAMAHFDSEELREYFVPGDEVLTFTTAEQAAEVIEEVLGKRGEVERIAINGMRRCVPNYSYNARAEKVLSCLVQLFPELERGRVSVDRKPDA